MDGLGGKMRPSLAFVSPNYGPLDAMIYRNHLAVIANASRTFDVKFVGVSDKMYLHDACNKLAQEGLMNNVDYIFWTENDMLNPFDCITKLYENKKDICSGLYFLRGAGYMPCMWMYNENPKKSKYEMTPVCLFPENEVINIDVPGMGCVLYNADIFRKLDEPWFDLKQGGYGQDVYFYRKVKDAGIKVYVDTKVQCEQLGDKIIVGIEDYRKKLADSQSKFNGFISSKEMR
jgi:hypothetical protein